MAMLRAVGRRPIRIERGLLGVLSGGTYWPDWRGGYRRLARSTVTQSDSCCSCCLTSCCFCLHPLVSESFGSTLSGVVVVESGVGPHARSIRWHSRPTHISRIVTPAVTGVQTGTKPVEFALSFIYLSVNGVPPRYP